MIDHRRGYNSASQGGMMRLLITGGAGFIGSNFIRHILTAYPDYEVTNLDKLTYAGNLDNLKDVADSPRYRFIRGDICHSESVREAIHRADAAVHFAAESHVDRSIHAASEFIHTNVLGTQTLLDAAREARLSRFVLISTDEVMGSCEEGRYFTESSPLRPNSPYCLHPDTPVLMSDNTEKRIADVSIGDAVVSFNFESRRPVINQVLNKFVFDTSELMEVKVGTRRILCTPQHKFFVKRPRRHGNGRLDTRQDFLSLPMIEVSANNLQDGDWLATTRRTVADKIESQTERDHSFARFLGYFVGDGYIKSHKDKRTGIVQKRVLLADQKQSFVEFYNSFLNSKGIIYKHKTKDCWFSLTGDAATIRTLENLEGVTNKAIEKSLPSFLLSYDEEWIKQFMAGLFDADGTIANAKIEICSHSPLFLRQVKLLLARLGIHASISGSKILVSDGKSVRQFQTAIPSLKLKSLPLVTTGSQRTNEDDIVWQPIKKPRSMFCSQKVYDLEVANDHNYVIEQNIISHNSASKAAAEHLARAARVTFGLDVVTTRASNNYGPYQFPEKLIPLMITNAMEDRELPVYGDGMNVRDWLYVEDCCRAIDAVLHRGKSGEVYNIGSRAEKTNLEVVRALLDLADKPHSLIRFVTDRLGHDRRYATDPAKIETELGWKPQETFESGLEKTVRWYEANPQWVARARSGEYRSYYEQMYGAREWSKATDE